MTSQLISKPKSAEYRVSSPSTHAARILMRNFTVCELGKVEASEGNIGVMIDYATQLFRITLTLDQVVASTGWVNADDLASNLDRLREAVKALEMVHSKMPHFEEGKQQAEAAGYKMSAPALHTARLLLKHFQFLRKAKLAATEKNIAILIDVCTDVFRIEEIVQRITARSIWCGRDDLIRNITELRLALRATELVRNALPRTSKQGVEVYPAPEETEVKVTKEQKRELDKFAQLVRDAQTVQDQQNLLRKAGYVSRQ